MEKAHMRNGILLAESAVVKRFINRIYKGELTEYIEKWSKDAKETDSPVKLRAIKFKVRDAIEECKLSLNDKNLTNFIMGGITRVAHVKKPEVKKKIESNKRSLETLLKEIEAKEKKISNK